MSTEEEQKETPSPRSRTALLAAYFASAFVASALVALFGDRIPAVVLGLALVTYLTAAGILLFRGRPVTAPRNGWRHAMPCYLSVQDRELRIIETNDLFREDFGDVVGKFCYEIYKDRDSSCPDCPVLKTWEDGQNHTSEETVRTKRGEMAHVVVTSAPLYDRWGELVAVAEMFTNVTEIKSLRQELDWSKQHFNLLFDIVPCYISVQDQEYRIIETNKLFREDFGQRVGSRCYEAYKGRDSVCPNCPVEKSFSDGKVHSSEEVVTTKDGHEANMIVYSTPIYDPEGKIASVMEVSTNITEFKRQHQLAMTGLAIAGMAHRIKNILMGLEGGIFVTNEGFETDDGATIDEGWKMIERNVDKISRMVRDLLYCSKEREPRLQDNVSPEAILREIYDLYRRRAAEDDIDLRLEIGDSVQSGTFDPEGLHNLVVNLTTNAIDACRFDPTGADKRHVITLSCTQDQAGDTQIRVADNGAGIPEDAKPRVFKGFFSTKGTEGTGVGLLVVQKVVQEHSGTIDFSSKEGEGSTFTVVLPHEKGRPRDIVPTDELTVDAGGESRRAVTG